jgi:hypothetical protein
MKLHNSAWVPSLTVSILVATLSLPLAGCGRSISYGGATPTVAFEQYKAARKDNDYKTAFGQTTPESQEGLILGSWLIGRAMESGWAPAKAMTMRGDIQKILEKHGAEEPSLQMMGDRKAAAKSMSAGVKDKAACVADLMTWIVAHAPPKSDPLVDEGWDGGMLVDVEIDGDAATGTVRFRRNEQVEEVPLSFRRIDGVWFINLDDKMPVHQPTLGPQMGVLGRS